jgi:polyferredoxin
LAKKLKVVSQILFLALFLVLIKLAKIHLWMVILLFGVIAALFFGRFYCGWICPINTVTDAIGAVYDKLGIKRRKVPEWIKKPIYRNIMAVLLIATLLFGIVSGKKLPVLVILTIAGALLSLVFVPSLWHRYLCPYGVILGITAPKARLRLLVEKEDCIGCGICSINCPGDAVEIDKANKTAEIDSGLCLECMECVDKCPKNSIRYGVKQGSYADL